MKNAAQFLMGSSLCLLLCSCRAPQESLARLTPGPDAGPSSPTIAAPAKPAALEATPAPQDPPPVNDGISKAAALPKQEVPGLGWKRMFNGEDLTGWEVISFAGHGEVEVRDGLIVLNMGDPFTGIRWTNPPPSASYEICLEAMRYMGSDFFCGLTVPVKDSHCSLIVGGWGGGLVGISSLNGMDASENETTRFMKFDDKKWYQIRLRVTPKRLVAWIENEKQVDVDLSEMKVSLRPGEIERSVPLGIACWQSTALLRGIEWRNLEPGEK